MTFRWDAIPMRSSVCWMRCRRMNSAPATGTRERPYSRPLYKAIIEAGRKPGSVCETPMNLEQFLANCPDYAKDLKLNLTNLLNQPELTARQTWGTLVASAIASRNPQVLEA